MSWTLPLAAGEISPAQHALALREAQALACALPAREGELAAFCQAWFTRLREQLAPKRKLTRAF